MAISANDIKNGTKFEYEGEVWVVIKNPIHTKPGKGGAYVQLEMKNVFTGTKTNKRFSSTEKFTQPHFEQIEMQYLYQEDNKIVMMDPNSFEQIMVNSEIMKDKLPFLEDGMTVKVEFYQEKPVWVVLPTTVILEVVETEPVIKGATVTSSYKPAILSNGLRITVPPYLVVGEKVVVRTEDATFVERAK